MSNTAAQLLPDQYDPDTLLELVKGLSIRDVLELADTLGVDASDLVREMEAVYLANVSDVRRTVEATDERPARSCARCGLKPDALVHNATANGHTWSDEKG